MRFEWRVVRKRRHAVRVVDSQGALSGQANQVCSETASAGYLAYHSRLGLGRLSGSAAVKFGRGVDRKSHRAGCHHGIGSFRQHPLQLSTPSFLTSVPPACTATHRHAASILAIWMQGSARQSDMSQHSQHAGKMPATLNVVLQATGLHPPGGWDKTHLVPLPEGGLSDISSRHI